MTVIMAFFIVFVMIATKVESATELFIVKNINLLEQTLKKTMKNNNQCITIKKMINRKCKKEPIPIHFCNIVNQLKENFC